VTAFADVPAGWRVAYGDADRAACLDHIARNRPRIRPKSLRDRLATGHDFSQWPPGVWELVGWRFGGVDGT